MTAEAISQICFSNSHFGHLNGYAEGSGSGRGDLKALPLRIQTQVRYQPALKSGVYAVFLIHPSNLRRTRSSSFGLELPIPAALCGVSACCSGRLGFPDFLCREAPAS